MRTVKLLSLILLIAAILTICLSSCGSSNSALTGNPSGNYRAAYAEKLLSILQTNGAYLDDVDYSAFMLFSLDDDDTPELLVNYADAGAYFTELFRYDGKEVLSLGRYATNLRREDIGEENEFFFVPGKGVFIVHRETDDDMIHEIFYTYRHGKVKQADDFVILNASYSPEYLINVKRVSYEEYSEAYRKYVPEGFDPDDCFDDDYGEIYMLRESSIIEFQAAGE